ncbi:RNA pyrophosphohydrolase [Acidiphilium sp.]|uniref:RNA pyrophosphohydrolase n=1 Tax=Acidiphilium sp. TaxID=527 RepID=UPI00258F2BF4|nr:RNA pyrophosphohydrolase [Acidiphilium sp.]
MTGATALPYRSNVGAALFSRAGKILVARRADLGPDAAYQWQLPQGGIDGDEDPAAAVLRELDEEIGTNAVEVLGEIPEWLSYDFPPDVVAKFGARHRGQRQRWFALRFLGTDDMIRLDAHAHPEFDEWRWTELSSIPALAVPFKRPIYERLARDFARFAKTDGA